MRFEGQIVLTDVEKHR